MKQWTDIREWIDEENRFIANGFDSITVYTGEEGTGKSYAMLARQILADPTFYRKGNWSGGWQPSLPTDRVLFDETDLMKQANHLHPGAAVQLDEADAHRRSGLTRERRKFLKWLKEHRGLRLRIAIGYPHVSQVDDDIYLSRVRYRAHLPRRGLLEVKSREKTGEETDRFGRTRGKYRWVVRGRFPLHNFLCGPCREALAAIAKAIEEGTMPEVQWSPVTRTPNCRCPPILRDYDVKKDDFTHRDQETPLVDIEEHPLIDVAAAMPVVARIKAAVGSSAVGSSLPVNQAFYSQVLDDIKRAMP